MEASEEAVQSFGQENFGEARLGDRRRARRLVRVADRILRHPGGTLPEKLKDPLELKGLYRLVRSAQVTHRSVLEPHQELVRARMAACSGDILLLHDTTELDYSTKTSLTDLGQIGNGHHRGYLCHNSLAVVAGTREVLGLAGQLLHCRPQVPPDEKREQARQRVNRESRLWQRGCEAAAGAPAGRRCIDVADRGADLFEYLDYEHQEQRHYLVRGVHNRSCQVQLPSGIQEVSLHDYARGLPARDTSSVTVPARGSQPTRKATVRIAAAPVAVLPPKHPRGQHGDQPLQTWVVYVGEVEPPDGAEPVEWILLTNVPVEQPADARQRADWYAHRWIIEELHKAQKTGCAIESPQFTAQSRLEPVIALLSVVAVQLLRLRNAARSADTQGRPATDFVPAPYVEVLSAWRYKQVRMDLSVHDFYLAVARLGGHQNRKHDHPPGWLVLWRGWMTLENMMLGATALQEARCGQT